MREAKDELDPRRLRKVGTSELVRRLDDLIASAGESRDADEQHSLLLDLQAHQIELEMQGRELREAQRSLEVSRDRYARLFDLAPVGYAVFDAQGRILELNLTAAAVLDSVRGRLIGLPLAGVLHHEDIPAFLGHVRDVVRDGDSVRTRMIEVRTGASGRVRVLRLLSLVRDEDAGRACFSAIIDVTEETKARLDRVRSDRLRQAVLDVLPAEVVVLDHDRRIVAVNNAWRLFADAHEASGELRDGVGLDFVDAYRHLHAPDGLAERRFAERIADVIARRRPSFSTELRFRRLNEHRWYSLVAVPLDHEIQGAVVVQWDITAQRHAEADAQRAREHWAQAARLNAVGVLAASLVHELTQPLSAARFFSGAAATLLDRCPEVPDTLKESLLGVDAQIERAAGILHRLREFLRHRAMERAPVSIDRIIGRALELVRWFADDKRVALDLDEPMPAIMIEADSLQLEQVLINLVCNSIQAIDATGTERREVSIRVNRRAREVWVTVSDTGPGIPHGLGERLFDIFTSTRDSGLGMGLAISREIIEAHGGELWADPDAEDGAVLRFTLPIAARTRDR